MGLVRTQVQFEREQHKRLREEAFRRGISVSALLRELVDERLGAPEAPERDYSAFWDFVGSARSGLTDVSERHDDYLAGIRK